MNVLLLLIVGISLLYESYSQAVVIGSNTEVSVITTSTLFPAADTDNTMLGFGWFQGGFTLEDETTSCTFSSIYPVSGIVNMNGGTLYLTEDVTLANPTQLTGLGTIIGNGHSIEFSETVTTLPPNLKLIKDLNVFFNGNVELTSTLTIQGNCFINANSNMFKLSGDAQIIIDTGSRLHLQGILLENLGNDNISCIDDTGHLILDNATICLINDMHFLYGDIHFLNTTELVGEHTFWYNSSLPCTVDQYTTLHIDGGLVLKMGRQSIGGAEPIIFSDNTSVLLCGESTLMITDNGIGLKAGRIEFAKQCTVDVVSNDTTCGIIIGDGISESNDMNIYLWPGSFLTFSRGAFAYNNVNPNAFYAGSNSSTLFRSINSVFNVATNCNYPPTNLILETSGGNFPVTMVAPGAILYFNGTREILPGIGDTIITAGHTTANILDLTDGGSVYFSSGSLYEDIIATGPGNILGGAGSLHGTVSLANSNSQLILNLMGDLFGTIDLQGGMLILANNITLYQPNCFASAGIINLQKYTMDFDYTTSLTDPTIFTFDTPMTWAGSNGGITISKDTTLLNRWTIQGICTIDGTANILTLGNGGQLVVAPNSHLILKNMRLNILDSTSIFCTDNTGKITLDNITWVQPDNYEFTQGALNFKNNVLLKGQNLSFSYLSTQTSTILADSSLILDNLLTFNYNPSNGATTLLACTDFTSLLSLNHSILNIIPGLQLTRGTLVFNNAPRIYALGNGLILGDEITSNNDVQMLFPDSSTLTISTGHVQYKNVDPNSSDIQLWNNNFIHFVPGTTLQLYTNMYVQTGQINFGSNNGGIATYLHRKTPCPITSNLCPNTCWSGNYNEQFFC